MFLQNKLDTLYLRYLNLLWPVAAYESKRVNFLRTCLSIGVQYHFSTPPENVRNPLRFLTISGGIKMWHWILMGYKITSTAFNSTFWRRSRMLFANFEEGEVTYLLWAMTQTGKTVASTASYFISSFDLVKAGKLLENIKFI